MKSQPKTPSPEMLTRADWPAELNRFIEDGTLVFLSADQSGTLHFMVPKFDETKTEITLEWHPKGGGSFDNQQFEVIATSYHDRQHYSVCGDDILEPSTLEELIDYLDSEPD